MVKEVTKIAKRLGARVVAQVPDARGGAFGAARLGRIVAQLQARLRPSQDKRLGRQL